MTLRHVFGAFIAALAFVFPAFPQAGSGERPVVIGHYETFSSRILAEDRTVLIGVPEDYAESRDTYPVLYVLDGSTDSFAEALSFVRTRGEVLVPEMIVVAVQSPNRNRDFLPGPGRGQADRFIKFFAEELFPYINSRYRVSPLRLLYGGSNAGLFVIYALLENPRAFSAYLAGSPMIVHRRDFLFDKIDAAAAGDYRKRFLSIIYGDRDMGPDVREAIETAIPRFERLRTAGLRLRTRDEPEEGHVPTDSLSAGLKDFFFGYSYPRDKRIGGGLAEARAYYERLSDAFGCKIEVPFSVLATIATLELTERKNYPKAVEAFSEAVSRKPRDLGWNFFLALSFFRNGDLDRAKVSYFKVKEIDPKGFPAPEFEEMKKAFEKSAAKDFLDRRDRSGTAAALSWLAGLSPADAGYVFDEKEFLGAANEMRRSGEVEDAGRLLGKATEFFPVSAAVWEAQGSIFTRLARKDEAVRCFQKAVDLDPQNRSARGGLLMIDALINATRDETRIKAKFRPGEATGLQGAFLGQNPPGMKPELFAPGLVSVFGGDENTLTITPDGKEIFIGKESGIWRCRLTPDGWTAPRNTGFPGYEMWISPASGELYYTGYDSGLWVMARSGEEWGPPRKVLPRAMFATMTRDGKIYTTVFPKNEPSIGVYEPAGGTYDEPVILGPEINRPNCFDAHPNITPDGRTLVFDSDRPEGRGLYVSFVKEDGTWTPARFLGGEFAGGSCSTYSPDGRYLFFMKNRDIYWVSAKVIDTLRNP